MHGYNDGKKDKPGLIKQLAKRVGILTRLRQYVTPQRFSLIANGIFNSKLIYAISVWGGVWKLPGVLDMENRCSPTLTKEDNRQLQCLQNKVMRLRSGLPRETPVSTLLSRTGQLSVQQLSAYHSVLQVYKTRKVKEPDYIYTRLFTRGEIVNEEERISRSLVN